MRNRLREMMPHAVILICNMYIVFFLIDRVNPAMNFIDNGLTKGLLAVLCAGAIYGALTLMRLGKRTRRRPAGQRPRSSAQSAARPASQSAARPASQSAARPVSRSTSRPVNRGGARPANRGAGRPAPTWRGEEGR